MDDKYSINGLQVMKNSIVREAAMDRAYLNYSKDY